MITPKALILAAGRGSRLGAMTEAQPKGWVSLGGQTLIERQLATLKAGGIREIAIVTGYRADAFASLGLPTFHNPQWAEANMVSSLCCAQSWLSAGPCLVAYADLVYAAPLIAELSQHPADLLLPVNLKWQSLWEARFADPLSDAETLQRHPDGRLKAIGQRPQSMAEVEGQFMGLLKLSPQGWDQISSYLRSLDPVQQARLDMTSLLQGLLAQGSTIETLNSTGLWLEVDQASDLALYENWLRTGHIKL